MSFDVKIERIPRDMSEKKTASPTISMVRHVLLNVNQGRGLWFLKAPHRTRKKGSERFRAIRVVDMGASQGIRVRCKPGGNDTCYEYTLMPPADVSPEVLMELLSAVHPSTLRMPAGTFSSVSEEVAIFKALVEHMVDPAPPIQSEKEPEHQEPERNWGENESISNEKDSAEQDLIPNEKVLEVKPTELAKEVSPSGKISTLNIVPDEDDEDGRSILLSYQFVLDRALIAISFVSEGGYAKRIVISDSIVRNLNVEGFIEVSTVYKVIESGMRALMMGLCNEGFVKRVFHGGRSTSKDTLQGYRLTPKGEKRILALREFLHPDLISKMSPDWRTSENHEDSDDVVDDEAVEEVEFAEPEGSHPKAEFTTDQILRLEAWLAELKDQNERISEVEGLIEDIRAEKEDKLHHLTGVEVAREKALKQREELDRELARLDAKKSELEGMVSKKDAEMADWNEELKAHTSKKAKLENDIGSSTGMRRT
jgi:hypothetical protein